jgi:hypothetical protein
MPLESKAQQRWAYANQGKNTKEGKAAKEFIAATPKSAFKSLPERKNAEKKKSQKDHMRDVMRG